MITLALHDGTRPVRRVTVSPTDPVHVLSAYVDGSGPKMLMYNYSLIMTSFTFSYYGITDDSDLFVVRRTEASNTMKGHRSNESCMRLMRKGCFTSITLAPCMDKESVNILLYEKFRKYIPDNSIIKEESRLQDLHNARLEMLPSAYQNEINEVSTYNQKYLTQRNYKLNLETNKGLEPSTDALPKCWRV